MDYSKQKNSKNPSSTLGTRKRILVVTTAYLPLIGGAEIAVKEITDRLGDEYSFDLITTRTNKDLAKKENIGRVSVYRVGGWVYLFPFWVMIKALRGRYDIIWSIMASYGAFSIPFTKIIKPRLKFLLTLQEGDHENHILERVGIFRPFYIWIFKSADYIQAISNYLAGFARHHGAISSIDIVPNGVDLEKFRNLENKKLKKDKIIIITTSRLVYKNGIDTLIQAAKELKSLLHDANYLIQIIGAGPDRSKLEDLTRELDVNNIVEFVGEVNPDEIPKYLANADIFVRASRSEGLGNSFLEAMAAGLPIIGTDVGGIPDFLRDPSNSSGQAPTGLFTRMDDSKDLAAKIELLIKNRELREKIAKNGQELIFNNYSWDKVANDMGVIFNKITL